jgi:outer membrane protein assembly factor BamA
MDRNGEELKERLRDSFQQRGYFKANVKAAEIKPLDPLARPMPVRVEAEVDEGPRFKFSVIKFIGNHVLSREELQAQLPFHTGDLFDVGRVRSGFENLLKLYRSIGYMNFSLVPDTDIGSDATITLKLEVNEGPQYRMGKLDMTGGKELAEQLQRRWELEPGKPFDGGYLDRFIEENKSLLGADFNAASDTHVSLDCRDLTASVQIQLDLTHPPKPIPSKLDCDDPQEAKPDQTKRPQS